MWLARALAFGLTVVSIALAVACGGGGGGKPSLSDPDEVRDQALAAMQSVASYRAELDYGERSSHHLGVREAG